MDIRGFSSFLMNISVRPMYTRVHTSFWLFVRNTKNSYIVTWAIPDSMARGGLFQNALMTAGTDKFRIARFCVLLHKLLVIIMDIGIVRQK